MEVSILPAGARRWVTDRAWPLGVSAAFIVVGMAWSFTWLGLRHGQWGTWFTPGDLWGTFRAAQFTSWGGFGAIYSAGTGLVALPGIAILLTPVAVLSDLMHLRSGFPLPTARPTAWLLLGPAAMAMVAPLLLFANGVAADLVAPARRRRLIVLAVAALAFPEIALMGHPEDTLAFALGLYSLRAAHQRRLVASAWLVGASLAVQPLTVLLVPMLLGIVGRKQAMSWLARASLFPGLLVAIVMAADPTDAWNQLFRQPNYPKAGLNHPTPWIALAPRLSKVAVEAGPGRLVAMGLAATLVVWGARFRSRPEILLVGAMLAFSVRVPFEAVMVPYYATPALTVAILLSSRSLSRLALTSALGAATTVVSFFHYGPWSYWALATAGLVVTGMAAALPLRGQRESRMVFSMAPPRPAAALTHSVSSAALAFSGDS